MKKHQTKKPPNKNIEKNQSPFKIINIISVALIIVLSTVAYFYTTQDVAKKETLNKDHLVYTKDKNLEKIKNSDNTKNEIKKPITFEEKTKALEIEYASNANDTSYVSVPKKEVKKDYKFYYEEPMDKEMENINEIVKKIDIPEINKIEDIKQERIEEEKTQDIIKQNIVKSNKPKLAIIIDDVTTSRQVKKIKKIGYNVNISFLPPTSNHKNSAKIATDLDLYMIHLPLQASSSKYEEEKTLYITHSIDAIESRIKTLKKLYPKTRFINNHTGSKFTSNLQAMDKLFQVLKKHNYTFLDSRTTAKSVARISAKKYGLPLLSRNIFLDNKKDTKYIQKQLKKAIKLAKKNGSAIAIGHPYNITFETLKNSKHLLKDLELVFVQQL